MPWAPVVNNNVFSRTVVGSIQQLSFNDDCFTYMTAWRPFAQVINIKTGVPALFSFDFDVRFTQFKLCYLDRVRGSYQ